MPGVSSGAGQHGAPTPRVAGRPARGRPLREVGSAPCTVLGPGEAPARRCVLELQPEFDSTGKAALQRPSPLALTRGRRRWQAMGLQVMALGLRGAGHTLWAPQAGPGPRPLARLAAHLGMGLDVLQRLHLEAFTALTRCSPKLTHVNSFSPDFVHLLRKLGTAVHHIRNVNLRIRLPLL